jgi:UDP-glucose 6-dehydrogenase
MLATKISFMNELVNRRFCALPVARSSQRLETLWSNSASVAAYVPKATEGADALVICTEWKRFMAPNFYQLAAAPRHKLIVDGRNLYDPERLAELGWSYYSIGRGASVQPMLAAGAWRENP